MHIVQVFGNEDVSAFTIIEAQVPVKAIRKVPVAISPENLTPGTERPLTCDEIGLCKLCLLYTSPSPRDKSQSRMPSSA